MNLAGALGGAAAGPLLALLSYAGLAWTLLAPVALVLVATFVAASRTRVGRPTPGSPGATEAARTPSPNV
jgi:ABC-type xylose transport system permease subunit